MADPDRPKPAAAEPATAQVIKLGERLVPAEQPCELNREDGLRIVHMLAADTSNIVVISYGKRRAKQRAITRRQIELCVQKGTVTEGPFLNQHGNWQMNLYRHAAGEEITCVVAIEWIKRVLVINTF